jgi:quercetin dioxygenase-like cupin family protein
MSVQKPVLAPPHGGETVTSSGGSSVEMKVESNQSGGEYGTVLWTVRAGEEPPLHTTRAGTSSLCGAGAAHRAGRRCPRRGVPGAYAALPRGVPHTIEVVGDQATMLLGFVPGSAMRRIAPFGTRAPDLRSKGGDRDG